MTNIFTATLVLTLGTVLLTSSAVSAQRSTTEGPVPNISGTWTIDAEKSYSKTERRKVTDFSLIITQRDDEIRLEWDYTIDGRRSNYSEKLFPDGRERDLELSGGLGSSGAWASTTRWKGAKLVRKYNYRAAELKNRSYRDRQEFYLDGTGSQLTVVTVFVNRVTASTPPPEQGRGGPRSMPDTTYQQKLVFNRK